MSVVVVEPVSKKDKCDQLDYLGIATSEQLAHYRALFKAIENAADKNSNVRQLATIGVYLTKDFQNTFDYELDTLKGMERTYTY